jgi:hypothetical protein
MVNLKSQIEPGPLRQVRLHSLSEAVKRFPSFRCNRPVHTATLTRWILSGVRARDGGRIKLEAKRLPGRWVVTDEAIDQFIERLTNDRAGAAAEVPVRTPAARSKAAVAASRELDRIGI